VRHLINVQKPLGIYVMLRMLNPVRARHSRVVGAHTSLNQRNPGRAIQLISTESFD